MGIRASDPERFGRLKPWIEVMTGEIDTVRPHAGVSPEQEQAALGNAPAASATPTASATAAAPPIPARAAAAAAAAPAARAPAPRAAVAPTPSRTTPAPAPAAAAAASVPPKVPENADPMLDPKNILCMDVLAHEQEICSACWHGRSLNLLVSYISRGVLPLSLLFRLLCLGKCWRCGAGVKGEARLRGGREEDSMFPDTCNASGAHRRPGGSPDYHNYKL